MSLQKQPGHSVHGEGRNEISATHDLTAFSSPHLKMGKSAMIIPATLHQLTYLGCPGKPDIAERVGKEIELTSLRDLHEERRNGQGFRVCLGLRLWGMEEVCKLLL